jgi:hypothetical protein
MRQGVWWSHVRPCSATASYAYDVLGRPTTVAIGGPHARTPQFLPRSTRTPDQRQIRGLRARTVRDRPRVRCRRISGPHERAKRSATTPDNRLREVAGLEGLRLRWPTTAACARLRCRVSAPSARSTDHAGRLMWQSDGRDGAGQAATCISAIGSSPSASKPMIGGTAAIRYLHVDAQGTPIVENRSHARGPRGRNAYEPFGKRNREHARKPGAGRRGLRRRRHGSRHRPALHATRLCASGGARAIRGVRRTCGGQKIPHSTSVVARSQWPAPCANAGLPLPRTGRHAMRPATSDWE